MNTKLQSVAAGVLDAAALFAVALTPVFVNYYSFRVFEPDKNAVFLSLMLLAALAGLILLAEGGLGGLRRALREPLVLAALVLLALGGLAAATSILWLNGWESLVGLKPAAQGWASVFGSQERAQGWLNLAGCLMLFAAVAWLARDGERRARLVAAILLGSVPVLFVAILQGLGVQLVAGEVQARFRAFGTLSNPIFLGAYLVMVLPLTLVRLAAAAGGRRLGLGLLAVAQLAALWFSASRGPQVGFVVAMVVLTMAWGVVRGRRQLVLGALGLLAAGALLLLVFNLPASPLASLRDLPVVGRFGRIAEMDSGSQATRLSIWRAVAGTLAWEAADPLRLAIGNGPESQKYALLRAGKTALGQKSEQAQLVDRSHNVLFDSLLTTGILGALALLAVYLTWLHTAARAAGLVTDRSSGRLLLVLTGLGALVGAGLGLLPGMAMYAGATTLLGLVLGLIAFLGWAAWRPAGADEAEVGQLEDGATPAGAAARAVDPLGIALLAVGAGVITEAAFGIQTVVTQALFWALAGLTVAVAARPRVWAAGPADAAEGVESGTVTLSWSAGSGALGALTAAVVASLTYSYVIHGATTSATTWGLWVALVVLTLVAAAFLAGEAGELASGVLVTAVPLWLGYVALRWLTLLLTADAAMLFVVTVWAFLALVLLTGWWLRPPAPQAAPVARGLLAGVYVVFAVALSAPIFWLLLPVQADIYFQSALANYRQAMAAPEDETAANAAATLFERATRYAPANDSYYVLWSELYAQLAATLPEPAQALQAIDQSQALIGRAGELDPMMPYHAFNRGQVQLMAIDRLPPEQRSAVAANAATALEEANRGTGGTDPAILNALALSQLLSGRSGEAAATIDISKALDPDRAETYALQGRVLEAAGRLPEAQAALEQARAKGVSGPEILIALGEIARKNGDLRTAAEHYRQAVEGGQVQDWQVLYNLGLLYRDIDEFEQALQWFQIAGRLAPPEQQATIEQAMSDLISARSNPQMPALPGNPAPGEPGSPFGGGTPGATATP